MKMELQPYAGKILAVLINGLTDRNAGVRKNNATTIGHIVGCAKDSSLEKLFNMLNTWYSEKKTVPTCYICKNHFTTCNSPPMCPIFFSCAYKNKKLGVRKLYCHVDSMTTASSGGFRLSNNSMNQQNDGSIFAQNLERVRLNDRSCPYRNHRHHHREPILCMFTNRDMLFAESWVNSTFEYYGLHKYSKRYKFSIQQEQKPQRTKVRVFLARIRTHNTRLNCVWASEREAIKIRLKTSKFVINKKIFGKIEISRRQYLLKGLIKNCAKFQKDCTPEWVNVFMNQMIKCFEDSFENKMKPLRDCIDAVVTRMEGVARAMNKLDERLTKQENALKVNAESISAIRQELLHVTGTVQNIQTADFSPAPQLLTDDCEVLLSGLPTESNLSDSAILYKTLSNIGLPQHTRFITRTRTLATIDATSLTIY
ncbi:unnamed protein product, partial [Trichogramma brassicae]